MARTFLCNEKVLFHIAHGMVAVPNEVRTIITQLQGEYYHVKYQEGRVSHIVSLHVSSLVLCTYIEATGSTTNAKTVENLSFSADVLRDEIIKFASSKGNSNTLFQAALTTCQLLPQLCLHQCQRWRRPWWLIIRR